MVIMTISTNHLLHGMIIQVSSAIPRIGIAIGSLTFTGSVVAAGKLHELIPGKPIILPQRWLLNAFALAGSAVMTGRLARMATVGGEGGCGYSQSGRHEGFGMVNDGFVLVNDGS